MRQIICGRYLGDVATRTQQKVALYNALGSSNRWASSTASNGLLSYPISASGRLENVKIQLGHSPNAAGTNRFEFQLFISGSPADLYVTFESTDTIGASAGSVNVTAGNRLRWRLIPDPADGPGTGTITLPWMIHSCEFVTEEPGVSVYYGHGVSTIDQNQYNSPFNPMDDFVADLEACRALITVKGAITRYDVVLDEAPSVRGTSVTYVLVLDDVVQDGTGGTVDTRLTVTSSTSGTWTGSLPLDPAQHEHVVIKVTGVGFINNQDYPRTSWCTKFVADTDGQWWMGGHDGVLPSNGAVRYQIPTANGINHVFEATESDKRLNGSVNPFTLTGFRLYRPEAPGSGKSWTFSLMKNGADAGAQQVILSDAELIDEDETGLSLTVQPNDTFAVKSTPSGAPAISDDGIAWAFVASREIAEEDVDEPEGVIGPLVWVHWPREVP